MNVSAVESLFHLDGRVALVTGAGQQAGSAIASGLAAAGADIIAVDNGGLLDTTAAQIREESGRRADVIQCDLSDLADTSRAIETVTRREHKVDILVNAFYDTGAQFRAHVLDTDLEAWDHCWTANVLSRVRVCQAVGRQMLRNGGGVIINLLSTVSFTPHVGLAHYGASKTAGWMFTRSLALECAPTVRVHGLAIGSLAVLVESRNHASREETSFIPLERYGKAREVVGAAVYLASDAASFSTGDVVFVDGGVAELASYPTITQPQLRGGR